MINIKYTILFNIFYFSFCYIKFCLKIMKQVSVSVQPNQDPKPVHHRNFINLQIKHTYKPTPPGIVYYVNKILSTSHRKMKRHLTRGSESSL